jgi:hypothetical protein
MKCTIFQDVTPFSLVEVYRCFRRIYCLSLQGQRVSQASFLLFSLLDQFFDPEDGGNAFQNGKLISYYMV